MGVTPAAVWLRVSTDGQETDNQVPDVERFAAHHGYDIVRRFTLDDSAWKNGVGGPEYQRELKAALSAAWAGEYKVIVVWALDRITRLGAEDALRLVRVFRERGCTLLSVKEPWLNGSPEIVDVLVAFAGWNAQMESARKSERVKAGLARRRAAGLPVGRLAGARDRKPRRTAGYMKNQNGRRATAPTLGTR
jgi:DNA invertase Pin-like site-specific DNA recombinase